MCYGSGDSRVVRCVALRCIGSAWVTEAWCVGYQAKAVKVGPQEAVIQLGSYKEAVVGG